MAAILPQRTRLMLSQPATVDRSSVRLPHFRPISWLGGAAPSPRFISMMYSLVIQGMEVANS
jgi:hypothetical protein